MKEKPSLVLSIMLFSVVGCIGQVTPELECTSWTLDSYVNGTGNLVSVLPNTAITANFQDGTVGGSAGCNSYSGEYQINGNTLTIGTIARTEMYCIAPAGIMDQEDDYLAALGSAVNYEISGNQLVMTNADGDVILMYTALELEGIIWNLDSYVNAGGNLVSVLPNTAITAHFHDGSVEGSAGCNSYFGKYEIDCNTIAIDSLASTRMFCGEPAGIMDQETDYLAALESATNYRFSDGNLVMTNARGETVLTFTA